MRSKIFKTALIALMALIAISDSGFAQDTKLNDSASTAQISTDITVGPVNIGLNQVKVKLHKLKAGLKNLNTSTNAQVTVALNNLTTELNADIKDIAPQINLAFKEGADVNINSSEGNGDYVNLTKNYSKTYSVDGNDVISISNQYGKVTVNTWTRNEVKVDVQIKTSSSNLLDYIKINDSKNGNYVNFTTDIDDQSSYWKSNFVGDGGHTMEVNYTVYMPAKNDLTIDSHFGSIDIPDMDGKVIINNAFGSFKSGSLSNECIIHQQSGDANMGNLSNCILDLSYGNMVMGTVDKLAANLNYSGIKINKVNETCAINSKYGGGIEIGDLGHNMRNLALNVSYNDVKIGLSGDESANFAIVTRYGDFNYDRHEVTISEKAPDDDNRPHSTKSYKGYIGKNANSGRSIAININYGNVRFQ